MQHTTSNCIKNHNIVQKRTHLEDKAKKGVI